MTSVNCSTSTPCPQNQECVYNGGNSLTGFCVCPRGFVLTSDGFCRDINECDQQTFPCGPGAMCVNTAGSYKCSCPPSSSGDPYGEGCFGKILLNTLSDLYINDIFWIYSRTAPTGMSSRF